ncbi:hypothetical protein GCM10022423_05390 [Flavobacterium ginsengiterrae]|uniref:Uncharacterized protein n=1 Tax=Flavobacterium ginsengiterrae TaxID=871695 RepID=A0ABP7G6V2_9FLAO
MIKCGKTKFGSQRYFCRACRKIRIANYVYDAYKPDINENIIQLTKEGLGNRQIKILKFVNKKQLSLNKTN